MAGYKLATYQSADGPRAGLVIDDKVFDAAKLTGKPAYATVLGILNDWGKAQGVLKAAAAKTGKNKPIAKAKLLAPVQYPSAIFCAGANYQRSRRRDGAGARPAAAGRSAHARARILAFHQGLARHRQSRPDRQDFHLFEEDGLGGRAGGGDRQAGEERPDEQGARATSPATPSPTTCRPAIGAIARTSRETSPFKADWVAHKSFDGSCPLGPWIVPASDIKDPQNLGIKLWVNGVLKQDSNTSQMIFNLAEQIAHLSSRLTLHPGDLILTGTPAGVGAGRGEFLKAGDVVKLWIEKIGEISNKMA